MSKPCCQIVAGFFKLPTSCRPYRGALWSRRNKAAAAASHFTTVKPSTKAMNEKSHLFSSCTPINGDRHFNTQLIMNELVEVTRWSSVELGATYNKIRRAIHARWLCQAHNMVAEKTIGIIHLLYGAPGALNPSHSTLPRSL